MSFGRNRVVECETDPFWLLDAWNLSTEELVHLRQIGEHGQLIWNGRLGHFETSGHLIGAIVIIDFTGSSRSTDLQEVLQVLQGYRKPIGY